MNKVVISIFAFALLALGGLTAYTFSPLSKKNVVPQVNPVSLVPTENNIPINSTSSAVLEVYHNRDMAENYYTVSVPKNWKLEPNKPAGSYTFLFPNGTCTAELMDVPDNSTLELYILSQDESALKHSLSHYSRTNYQKISIDGNEIYQLTYTSITSRILSKTVRAYISGQDRAGLLTCSSAQDTFTQYSSVFDAVIKSFKWENSK